MRMSFECRRRDLAGGKGGFYFLVGNDYEEEARIFFSQGCEVKQEME